MGTGMRELEERRLECKGGKMGCRWGRCEAEGMTADRRTGVGGRRVLDVDVR